MANVYAISTNKGGVLKTSVTTNLAGVLSQNHRVLIIDADNQGNALLSFGMNPDECENTLYEVLMKGVDVENAIYSVHENIDIIPSDDGMARFEFEVLTDKEDRFPNVFGIFKEKLSTLNDKYDYILIDTPPNLGLLQGNVLSYVEKVLIPFQPETYSMRSLVKTIENISDFSNSVNKNLSIEGIIATLVDSRTTLHSEVLQQCRRYCAENDLNMYDTVIPRSVRFASAVAYQGLPATLTGDKNHPLVKSYNELSKEVFN